MSYIVGVHCKYCGHESFDVCSSRKQVDRAKFADTLPDTCSSCGRKLVKNDEAYYCKSNDYSNTAGLSAYMKECRDANYEKVNLESQEKSNTYVEKSFEKKFSASSSKLSSQPTASELKEYLRCIMQAYSLLFYAQNQLQESMNQNVFNRYALKYDESGLKLLMGEELDELQKKHNKLTQLLEQCENQSVEVTEEEMEQAGFIKPEKPKEPKRFSGKKVQIPDRPCEPVYGVPGFFNKKRVLKDNEEKRLDYESALKEYEDAVSKQEEYLRAKERYQERLAAYKEREKEYVDAEAEYSKNRAVVQVQKSKVVGEKARRDLAQLDDEIMQCKNRTTDDYKKLLGAYPSKCIDDIISAEIKKHKKRIDDIAKTINELYSYNVIYPKYRDYVAICQMYEYIDAGRCTSLEGPHGAYNLYESDIKAKLVIQQLAHIVSGLEDVKKNQGALYSELKEVTGQLHVLQGQMNMAITTLRGLSGTASGISYQMHNLRSIAEKTARNTEAVAYNTALTAYYSAENAYWSKKNAELTDSLGYLIALN